LRVQSALLLYSQHRFEQGLAEGRKASELEPNNPRGYWVSGLCYEQLGKWEAAEKAYRRVLELSPRDVRGVQGMGYLLGRTGRKTEARQILESLIRENQQGMANTYSIAIVYMGIGDAGQALGWLEKAVSRHEPGAIYLGPNPRLEPLHSHPRYVALLRRIGLAGNPETARQTAPRAGSARR
jgi:Flp pilus assembly protein TadD